MTEKFDLTRFHLAHNVHFETALKEIKEGRKHSHWMWFIFPQLDGLGKSERAKYYSLKSLEEAKAFLEDPILGSHIFEISEALLNLDESDPSKVFGYPDYLKLRSSMTLFKEAKKDADIFDKVLEKYFESEEDEFTIELLESKN